MQWYCISSQPFCDFIEFKICSKALPCDQPCARNNNTLRPIHCLENTVSFTERLWKKFQQASAILNLQILSVYVSICRGKTKFDLIFTSTGKTLKFHILSVHKQLISVSLHCLTWIKTTVNHISDLYNYYKINNRRIPSIRHSQCAIKLLTINYTTTVLIPKSTWI